MSTVNKQVFAKMITEPEVLKELSGQDIIVKEDGKVKNSFWALVSVEDPQGDRDGDIIRVAGITYDLNPEKGQYIPLLAGHQRKLADGSPPEFGRIEELKKFTYNAMPALAMRFSFALNDDGTPMDDLVAKYYKRYTKGYWNTFSVGMESTSDPIRMSSGGRDFTETHLFEVSGVSIPANKHAIGLTRSDSDEGMDYEAAFDNLHNQLCDHISKGFDNMHNQLVDHISKTYDNNNNALVDLVSKFFGGFESRFDLLESSLVANQKEDKPESKPEESDEMKEFKKALAKLADKIK